MRAFRIAYDGRPYHGFQRQPSVSTVEDALLDALRDLDVLGADERRPSGYAAAGRTDAGVSATAQTVAFVAPEWLEPRALNGCLPTPIRAWASAEAPAGFHATRRAASRTYTYHLYAPRGDDRGPGASSVDDAGSEFDDERARGALSALVGTHDFHNLTTEDDDTTRTVEAASAEREGAYLVLTVRAEGFLRHLVRRIVSLVRAVATGAAPPEKVDRVLSAAAVEGGEGVPTAPAEPLVLTGVAYPELSFAVDATAAESARRVFADRRRTHRTRARVAGTVLDGIDRTNDG